MAQVVKHLSSKYEAWSSNSSTTKKKKKKVKCYAPQPCKEKEKNLDKLCEILLYRKISLLPCK
jgi:hypothetical protein